MLGEDGMGELGISRAGAHGALSGSDSSEQRSVHGIGGVWFSHHHGVGPVTMPNVVGPTPPVSSICSLGHGLAGCG